MSHCKRCVFRSPEAFLRAKAGIGQTYIGFRRIKYRVELARRERINRAANKRWKRYEGWEDRLIMANVSDAEIVRRTGRTLSGIWHRRKALIEGILGRKVPNKNVARKLMLTPEQAAAWRERERTYRRHDPRKYREFLAAMSPERLLEYRREKSEQFRRYMERKRAAAPEPTLGR